MMADASGDPSIAQAVADMRSDTVTKPTRAMREAMLNATVGDDVLGDDPTVMELEAQAAKWLGKEAALFTTSGTQANLCAVMVHCAQRGCEVILGCDSHICIYEGGGIANVAGAHPRQLPNNADGTIDLDAVEAAIRPNDVHFPRTALLCIENTHNRRGGVALPVEYMDAAGALCKRRGLRLHVDGARLPNACVKMGVSAARMVQAADSVSLCLSKGLGAPAGSVLAGSKAFIAEARRARKALGGGLRQVGVLAAPALLALTTMWNRLEEDHARLVGLHAKLATVKALDVPPMPPTATNMLYVGTRALDAKAICQLLESEHGVRVLPVGPHEIRLVCNYMVTDEHVEDLHTKFAAAAEAVASPV
uniref:Aromatic amino acid beta-eliminating lyase/threonine aldolase domain-containing protein n=1 Tax=Prasinoderma coloniale TaxID=156133 RepID=A0A7R9Y289_9VIRI